MRVSRTYIVQLKLLGFKQQRKKLHLEKPYHGVARDVGVVAGLGKCPGLVPGEVKRFKLALELGAMALHAIIGDWIALCLEPFGKFLVAAERALGHTALQFGPEFVG